MEIVPFYSTNSEQPEPVMTRIKPRDKSEYTLVEEWTDEEKQIIDALMIKKLTLREAEEVLNIPRSTIARKRDRILEKDGNLSQTF
jgi:DNA-directed RNA polymerase specialized sigma subunit